MIAGTKFYGSSTILVPVSLVTNGVNLSEPHINSKAMRELCMYGRR